MMWILTRAINGPHHPASPACKAFPSNGFTWSYLDVGQGAGPPLVCVHGSLCDFRIWSVGAGPLSRRHRRDRAVAAAFLPRALGRLGIPIDRAACVDDNIGFHREADIGRSI